MVLRAARRGTFTQKLKGRLRSPMRLRSSSFAGVRFLDRDAVVTALRRLSTRLVSENPAVRAVLLFGSLARGDYCRRSDADLLICLRSTSGDRPMDRIPTYLEAFLDAPVPVDVLPLTEEE